MDKIDCVVIGAGVVGLAIAREMALAGHKCQLCRFYILFM